LKGEKGYANRQLPIRGRRKEARGRRSSPRNPASPAVFKGPKNGKDSVAQTGKGGRERGGVKPRKKKYQGKKGGRPDQNGVSKDPNGEKGA